MTDAYLHSVASRQPGPTGNLLNVYLFMCIAVFVMLIACINFMNLSTARSLERAKEVGVRKVLGASVTGIVVLLSKEFTRLVIIAIIIAVPLCYWAMTQWLQGFAYRITIGPVIFLEAGLISLAVAIIAIAWQSVKAANANPVQSLRNE